MGVADLDNPVGDDPIGVMLLVSSLERGGAERQVVELANGLDPSRFRVHVCSLSDNNPLAPDLRCPERFRVVRKRHKYDILLIARVAKLLRRLGVSVVHSFLFDAEMVGRLAGRWAGVPAVICSNRCPHLSRSGFKLWLSRLTSDCFDLMIANSWTGQDFEHSKQGVELSRVCVVPNGVDIKKFHPRDASAPREALGIAPDTKVVGMFAHFRSNKNHLMFLEAAARVCEQRDDVVFLCIGRFDDDGPDSRYAAARRVVHQRGIADRVKFLGERRDVVDLYNICDVKVLASVFEGTANVLLEAMACGTPVVATDAGDNARVVEEGKTGYIVAPDDWEGLADRVLQLVSDDVLRKRFGRNARDRSVSEFSVEALVRRTGEVYLRVIKQKEAVAAGVDCTCRDVSHGT